MPVAIEVSGLTRDFGSVKAVQGLDFEIESGEVFGVLGPNGAGKTTTVRLLNGVLTPTSGSARVFGLDPVTQGSAVRARAGVLTETPSLYERLSARENLEFYGVLYGLPDEGLAKRVSELLDFFELTPRAADKVGGFSKGMKQRLALARALLHEPQVLYLDEPTAGLDPEAARQVSNLIESLSRESGRTVFLATHNLDEAQRLCDRVAVLNEGRVLALGSLGKLARELWRSHWVDIELLGEPPPELVGALRAARGVIEVATDGDSLAIQVDAEEMIPAVVTEIATAGGQVFRVNPRQHTLEEVYFELQRRGGSDAPEPALEPAIAGGKAGQI